MKMIIYSHANKTYFQKEGLALSLDFKLRIFGTRKLWPVGLDGIEKRSDDVIKTTFMKLLGWLAYPEKKTKNVKLLKISQQIGGEIISTVMPQ